MPTPIGLQNYLTMSSPQFSSRMTGQDYATTAGSTALAMGANAFSMKQLKAQLELEEKKLNELIAARKNAEKMELLNAGLINSPSERSRVIHDMTGINTNWNVDTNRIPGYYPH